MHLNKLLFLIDNLYISFFKWNKFKLIIYYDLKLFILFFLGKVNSHQLLL